MWLCGAQSWGGRHAWNWSLGGNVQVLHRFHQSSESVRTALHRPRSKLWGSSGEGKEREGGLLSGPQLMVNDGSFGCCPLSPGPPSRGSCLGTFWLKVLSLQHAVSLTPCMCILWKSLEPIQYSPSTIDKWAAVTSNQWLVNSQTNPPLPSTRLINIPGN